jgi:hypothetical protein
MLGGSLRKRKIRATGVVEKEILRYFLRNPRGADTLEGIARWRLLEERLYSSIEETDRALNSLVSQGFLIDDSSIMVTGRLFRLDLNKRDLVKNYLKESKRTLVHAASRGPASQLEDLGHS